MALKSYASLPERPHMLALATARRWLQLAHGACRRRHRPPPAAAAVQRSLILAEGPALAGSSQGCRGLSVDGGLRAPSGTGGLQVCGAFTC